MAITALTGYGTVTAETEEELVKKIKKLHAQKKAEYEDLIKARKKSAPKKEESPEEVVDTEEAPEESLTPQEEEAVDTEEASDSVDIDSLSRDELLKLAEKYGLETYRVRTDTIRDNLKTMLNKHDEE